MMLIKLFAHASVQSLVVLASLATVSKAVAAPGADASGKIVFKPHELNRCEAIRKRQISDDRNRIYDNAYSTYVEICAASTWQMRGASDGGNYGHAFGIIKGACVVKDASGKPVVPPQLKPCDGGVVGISSDYILFNVQWLATEGRDFFLYGNHNPGEPLDEAAASRIKNEAVARGIFEGVEFQKTYREEIARDAKALGMTPEEYRPLWEGKASLGTDFGIAASRGGVDCTRIPMRGTKPGFEDKPLKDLIAFLNEQNLKVYNHDAKVIPEGQTEPTGFAYDSAVNNCTSNFVNALAAAGFWRMRDTSGHPETMFQMFMRQNDISVPYNSMFDAYKRGSRFKLKEVVDHLREDQKAFEYFKTTGWYAHQVGTMIEAIPALEYMNSVYDTSNNTNFASIVYELQKKLLISLKGNSLLQMAANTTPGQTVGNLMRDWLGIDLANLQAIPPSDKTRFDGIRANAADVGTNMINNLKVWNNVYANALTELNRGTYGDDEVVEELKGYLHKQFERTSILLSHSSSLKPAAIAECPAQ